MSDNLNDIIADRLVAHQVRILRLAEGAAQEIVQRIQKADSDTFVAFGQSTNDDGSIAKGRLSSVLKQTFRINEVTYKEIGKFLEKELTDLAHYEVEFSNALLETHLPEDYRFKLPPKAFTSALVQEDPIAGGLLEEWVEGLKQGRFTRVRNATRISVGQNESVLNTVRRVRGKKSMGYRDGAANVSFRAARQLVTTAFNHVANKSRVDYFKANKEIVHGWMWTSVLDDVTCQECGGLDGEILRPDELRLTPPAHPNCRCMVIPVLEPIDEDDFVFQMPARVTYSGWLKNQPASMQNEILGVSRAAMFRRGFKIQKFVDGSGARYNLAELRQIEGKLMATKVTTDVAKRRSSAAVLRNYGWKPDIPDIRDHMFALAHPEKPQLPPKVSLREGMPKVFDQGNLGSCVANACIAAHMFVHKDETMLSRLALYWSARFLEGTVDEDSGVMIRDGVKALRKFGVCTEKTWPYKIRKFRIDPPDNADKEGLEYRITEYSRLTGLQDYQKCLADGYPFVFGFTVYDNIYDTHCSKYGVMDMPTRKNIAQGGHAVLAVGYDTNFHNNPVFKKSGLSKSKVPNFMFEVRNSWGPSWADGGHFWMPAEYINSRDLSDDFWTIRS